MNKNDENIQYITYDTVRSIFICDQEIMFDTDSIDRFVYEIPKDSKNFKGKGIRKNRWQVCFNTLTGDILKTIKYSGRRRNIIYFKLLNK